MTRRWRWLGGLVCFAGLALVSTGTLLRGAAPEEPDRDAPSGWALVGLWHKPARTDLQVLVQLRQPAHPDAYARLWEAGARVVDRDYERCTATVRVSREKLPAIAALPHVRGIRPARTNVVPKASQ